MSTRISQWVRKQPVLAFYILAFVITWAGWIPQAAYSRGIFPFDNLLFYILGGVGPLLAGIIVHTVLHGKVNYGKLFRPLGQWRVNPIWYVVGLFGYAAMWVGSLALRGEVADGLAELGTPLSMLTLFLTSFLAAIPESIAWRGFALPRLQRRYNALVASLIVGVLWALWHLPLLFNRDSVMGTYPLVPFLVEVTALSIIYTWIFNNTRGSLLIVTLFHAASNTVGPFVGIEQTVVVTLVALLLVFIFGPAHLSRRSVRIVESDDSEPVAQSDYRMA